MGLYGAARIPNLFPVACFFASKFERYQFHSLSFEFRAACASLTSGVVVLGLDFDPDDVHNPYDNPDASRVVILSLENVVQTHAWESCTLNIPANLLNKFGPRYVRSNGDFTQTIEPRTADLGLLYIGSYGTANYDASTWVGDVFVRYDVELTQPQMTIPQQEAIGQKITCYDTTHAMSKTIPDTGGGTLAVAEYLKAGENAMDGDEYFDITGVSGNTRYIHCMRDFFGEIDCSGAFAYTAGPVPPDNGPYTFGVWDPELNEVPASERTLSLFTYATVITAALAMQTVALYGLFKRGYNYRMISLNPAAVGYAWVMASLIFAGSPQLYLEWTNSSHPKKEKSLPTFRLHRSRHFDSLLEPAPPKEVKVCMCEKCQDR